MARAKNHRNRLALGCLAIALSTWGCDFRQDAKLLPVPPKATESAKTSTPDQAAPPKTADTGVAPLSPGARTEDERNSVQVFRLAAPSTVFVTQSKLVVNPFFGTATEVPAGTGSGFVWDEQGHVVTNYHVIRGAETLKVTLDDQQTFSAKVVGVEPRKDIAVLKLDAPGVKLVPIKLAPKNSKLEVGQKTIAIGNPFGLDHTMTIGIVSALGRQVQGIGGVTIRDMIQTDAAINPGNSGGPLLDSSGHLIGMNTMIFSRSGASAGIGFAVPASAIVRVVPQIIEHGKPRQVGLGVQIDPSQRLESRLRISGVIVLQVIPGSPAHRAGLKGIQASGRGISLGDVIVGINDEKIEDYDDLYNILDRYEAGTEVKVWLHRAGERVSVDLELIEIP
jgi:S1-C subfamily serine protease